MLARPSLLAAISAAFLVAPSAFACSCVCPDKLSRAQIASKVKERLTDVIYAFDGRVVSSSWHDGPDNSRFAKVIFKPTRMVKGERQREIEVTYVLAENYTSCDDRIEEFISGSTMRVFAVGADAYRTVHNKEAIAKFGTDAVFAQTDGCDCYGWAAFDRNALHTSVLRARRKR